MTTTVAPRIGTGVRERGTPQRSRPVRKTGRLRGWCVFALVLVARGYRTLLLTLVVVATVPAVGSWSSFLVRTGSMEPSIRPGDVVIGQPFGTDEKVPVGRVMVFQAPPGSGAGSELRVHRVVESLGHDRYTTAGDANPTPDAAPVPRANFRSRAIIQVPYVGRPLVWLDDRQYGRLLLWLVMTVVLLQLSFRRVDGDPPEGSGWRGQLRRVAARLRVPRHRHRRTAPLVARAATVLGIVALTLAGPASADAAFSAHTTSRPNTWKAATNLDQAYTAAVTTDAPYAFYLLDDTSGANAADIAGNSRTGTYTSVATYLQAGGLPNNPGYAVGLAANSGRMVGGGTGLTDPTTFSVEMWFKTTTAAGGKLIGFENSRNATSTSFDRELFMRTDGKLVYMGATSTSKLLVSTAALNNGAWHHVVVTSVPSGSQETAVMYVDGAQVATGNTSKAASSYTGWWRVGFGKLPTGSGYPSTGNFTGSVDNVAIYTTQLSATRVAAHYNAR